MWQNYYKTTEGHIVAYHLASKDNEQSIRQHGLIARECRATTFGSCRTSAVYLFAARQDAYDPELRKFLFDEDSEVVVFQVTIPENCYRHLNEDGLFNMSAICADGSYPTALQYRENIPAEWIK